MVSRYLRIRKKDGMVAVFHDLHPDPVYCSQADWDAFNRDQGADGALLQGLRARKLVIDSESDDRAEYSEASARLEKKHNRAETLYLMTAQGCNFECRYCFIPEFAREHGQSMLTEKSAFAGIDLWYEHVRDAYDPASEYYVIFYGGEPLLNIPVIRSSLIYLREKQKLQGFPEKLNRMVVTNGLLIDDAFVSLCAEHEIMVVVSLDGPQGMNDAMRVDESGKGTYDGVASAVSKLVAGGVRTFGSVTVTPANVRHLDEVSNHLASLGIEKFGFNFVKGKKLIEMVGKDGVERYCDEASEAVLRFARSCRPGFEYQLEKKIRAFDEQDFFPHDCTCYGSQLVIQPDGEISNCPFYKAHLGSVGQVGMDFRIWDQPIVKEWRKRLPLYNPAFETCDAKSLCGAGCAWSSEELYGDILAVDKVSRKFGEEAFNELIWSKM